MTSSNERAENEAVKIFEAHTHHVIGETRGGVPLEGFIRSKLERAIADAIAAAEARGKAKGAREEREACLADIGGERVDAEGSESSEDIAYNAALGHAAGAIKSRAAIQAEKECT